MDTIPRVIARETLERHQVLVYLAAVVAGLIASAVLPGDAGFLEVLLWPLLGLLLYSTFTQVPLTHLREALGDMRFLAAAITGNFVLLPPIVWGLMILLPDDSALRLGALLVLLVPCTDWFITFTHLGRGDTRHAIAFSPVSLLLQILLLPIYLWLFLGGEFTASLAQGNMFAAFFGLIVVPLAAALVTERWVDRDDRRRVALDRLAWLPVPLLALVVFVIATTQSALISGSPAVLGQLSLLFVAFLILAALLARFVALIFRLPANQGRVLAFSFGTRNSFVVLPLALALPASYEIAVVAIVLQSVIELAAMALWIRWVPERLFPARA
jgi:arsenite transporter